MKFQGAVDVVRNGVEPATGNFDLIVIAASAGGVKALQAVLGALPADFPLPIAIVQHRSTKLPNRLAEVLGRYTKLKVKLATQGETPVAGTVYLAPPDLHLLVEPGKKLVLMDGGRIRHVLSSANPLFSSSAESLAGRVIGVVLTGGDSDATDGVQSIHQAGGVVIAQDDATSEHFHMPKAAIATGCVDYVLSLSAIGPKLVDLVAGTQPKSAQRTTKTLRRHALD